MLVGAANLRSGMALAQEDTLFIEMNDNSMLIIPQKYIDKRSEDNQSIQFELKGDTTISVLKSEIRNTYNSFPYARPVFESFKFNNKFNDQLFTDAIGEIDQSKRKINVSVGCIGKRLTPSFKLPEGVDAYVDNELQHSKETRVRFDKTVRYTVAYPNQNVYEPVKKDDSKYMVMGWTASEVELTADMLSTNAPTNHSDHLANMLDGDHNTIFHSTWGSGNYTPLAWYSDASYGDGASEWPYLEIALPEPLYRLQFSYTTRNSGSYAPLGLILQGSNDGIQWKDIRSFNVSDDDLPTTQDATYTSPDINLGGAYQRLRLQLTAAQHKNYLVFSEFSLYKVESTQPQQNEGLWMTRELQLDGNAPNLYCLNYDKEKKQWPCVEIAVPEETYNLQFSYTTPRLGDINLDNGVSVADVTELVNIILGKSQNGTETADVNLDNGVSVADVTELVNIILGKSNGNYCPLSLTLQGSLDGSDWSDIQTFTAEADGLPTTQGSTWTSPVMTTEQKYKFLRLRPNKAQEEEIVLLGGLHLYTVENCRRSMSAYGTEYDVEVDFLTDHPTSEYGVPRIDIWFGDEKTWSSSMWIGRNGKTFYEDATIQIDGGGVYPDMEKTAVQIKGRGNSTWDNSYSSKNPYRLKFAEKVKPLGMTKGKSWVLLCNKQRGSMTTNALAMKVADMVETRGCNHIVPVELYINNQYRGSYNLTEKTGFSNNSIDIDDETNAVMLELDTYGDETIYTEANYGIKTKIKEPDFTDATTVTNLTSSQIMDAFNALTYDVQNNGENAKFDVESVVRAMFVTDLVRNEELMHPKSWFIYNTDITHPDSLWNLGPVWDFDWSFGYERGSNYFIVCAEEDLFSRMSYSNTGYPFFYDLLRGSEKVKREYYRLWHDFMTNGKLEELIEYCDDYYEFANASFQHNYSRWNDGNNYATHTANAKSWLEKRARYIYNNIEVYDLSEDIVQTKEEMEETNVIDVGELMGKPVNVYALNGILVRRAVPRANCFEGLAPGVYIVDGRKYVIK